MYDLTIETTSRLKAPAVSNAKVYSLKDRYNFLSSIEESQKKIEHAVYGQVCSETDTQKANAKLEKLAAALRAVAESL